MKHPPPLSSSRDFRRVMASSTLRRVRWGVVHFAAAEGAGPSRLGLSVPARAGGAVQRNRIKRRLRAAFRSSAAGAGLDVVIRADAGTAAVEFQELEKDLKDLSL
jgi:ribonuclease P protein component